MGCVVAACHCLRQTQLYVYKYTCSQTDTLIYIQVVFIYKCSDTSQDCTAAQVLLSQCGREWGLCGARWHLVSYVHRCSPSQAITGGQAYSYWPWPCLSLLVHVQEHESAASCTVNASRLAFAREPWANQRDQLELADSAGSLVA